MELYIHGAGLISAAGNNTEEDFLRQPNDFSTDRLLCKEPDYTGIVPPMQLRRMSKVVRMGIGASHICMQQAGAKPDAISIGTAMGCLQDTEVFLAKMIAQSEQMLTPTAFIQSTHNTVGGQIALLNSCYGHNMTYVHRGHSFEHAVINTALYLDDHPEEMMLTGGIDELTETSIDAMQHVGLYRCEEMTSDEVMQESGKGSIAGEGAGFFLLSKKAAEGALCIRQIEMVHAKDGENALQHLKDFLENIAQPDLIISGMNGDTRYADFYEKLPEIFADKPIVPFKNYCGEYATASAFALGMLVHMAKADIYNQFSALLDNKPVKSILLLNNYKTYYSFWHITA